MLLNMLFKCHLLFCLSVFHRSYIVFSSENWASYVLWSILPLTGSFWLTLCFQLIACAPLTEKGKQLLPMSENCFDWYTDKTISAWCVVCLALDLKKLNKIRILLPALTVNLLSIFTFKYWLESPENQQHGRKINDLRVKICLDMHCCKERLITVSRWPIWL